MSHCKVVYILSDINKSLAFEWIADKLNKDKILLTFILIGSAGSELASYLRIKNIPYHEINFQRRSQSFSVLIQTIRILRSIRPDVVHTHLFYANLIGLTASWLLKIKKRIMTRHHAMIHYIEYPKGRKWDVICNGLATCVVAISENVRKILLSRDKIDSTKVSLIHHGFVLTYFSTFNMDRVHEIRSRYKFEYKAPVIGVISRYIELKGIQYIVTAFQQILERYPNAHLVLANAQGNYSSFIKKMLRDIPAASYSEIIFESDLAELYQTFDVYVHVPIDERREAFGQTYVEALAAGVPSVFTLSGVAPEFIKHEHNALVVPFEDAHAIATSVIRILEDDQLEQNLIEQGKRSVQDFSIDKMIHNLEVLYGA